MEKVLELLKTVLRKKLLLIIAATGVAVVLVVFFGLKVFKRTFVATPEKAASVVAQALTISVPEGAYNRQKSFEIKRISPSNLHPQLSTVFVSEVYEVSPIDKIEEFAMKPVVIRYRLPKNLYLGEEYGNVKLAYIPNLAEPIYRTFGGAYIDMDESGAYVEVEAFHASAIGIIADVPQKQKLGLQLIKENSKSVEPALLLVPDVDRNFLGFVPSTFKQEINLWDELFPNRTIMYYEYPIVSTKSKSYMNGFKQFSRTSTLSSYLLYEAEKLAAELLRLKSLDFDILAHGVGGLIARLAVERHPEIKNVRKIVLVSTPNKGTNVVNPIYFGTLFFDKPSNIVATNFGLDRSIVDSMKSHLLFYLESIGPIYREISVSSQLLSLLNTPRQDIEYLCVVGNKPPMSINVKGTPIENFYPELATGVGDGVVTLQSAKIEGVEFFTVDGSFFDCYLSSKFQEKVKGFLAYQPEKIPQYKAETYPEKLSGARESESVQKPPQPLQIKVPNSFTVTQFMKRTKTLQLQNVIDIFQVNSKILVQRDDGLYDINSKLLYRGEFRYAHVVSGKLGFFSGKSAFLYDGNKFSRVDNVNLLSNFVDVLVSDIGIFGVAKEKELVFYKWENQWKKLADLPGEYAKFVDGDYPHLLTNEAVYVISSTDGSLKELLNSSQINAKGKSVDFTTFVRRENLLVLGLRSYSVVFYDLSTRAQSIVAEGWIDPIFIGSGDRYLFVCGNSSVLFFDQKTMNVKGEIHKFNGTVRKILPAAKEVYALVDRRIEVYELPQ
ncbi:MAG: alpha/beta hydrolase [Pseudothermotoga sp.]